MNIRKLKLMIVGAMMMCASVATFADTFTWSRYDLTFNVPDGGFVTYNSASTFEVRWDDLTVSIRLFNKVGADGNFLKYNLQKTAAGYNMFDSEMRKAKVKGFDGYSLTGTLPDGSRASLTNVVSKKSKLAMLIEINYLDGNDKTVDNILKSFAEGKKQTAKQPKAPKQKIQKKGAKPKPIKPGTTESGTPQKLYEI